MNGNRKTAITTIAALFGACVVAAVTLIPAITQASSDTRSIVDLTSDQRSILACGYSILIEADPAYAQPTRQEAISKKIELLEQVKDQAHIENRPSQLPNELKILLLQNALDQVPAAEKGASAEDLIRVNVTGLGSIEIDSTSNKMYYVTALDFVPQLPDKCGQGQ